MERKTCAKCKIDKDVCEFYKHSKKLNSYRGQCKKCMNVSSLNYKTVNTEKMKKK